MVIKGICSAQVSVEEMYILGLAWRFKTDRGKLDVCGGHNIQTNVSTSVLHMLSTPFVVFAELFDKGGTIWASERANTAGKSNFFPFLSHPSLPSRMLLVQIVQRLCNGNYWKEATHLSRRSEFVHHPMVSPLAPSRIFALSHRGAHRFSRALCWWT